MCHPWPTFVIWLRLWSKDSKAFDKVWLEGLPIKLKQNRISGNLLSIITDFLNTRIQRSVLNDQKSPRTNVEDGVPQDSILGLLLFLININNLSDNLASNPNLFVDDPSLLFDAKKINSSTSNFNIDLW